MKIRVTDPAQNVVDLFIQAVGGDVPADPNAVLNVISDVFYDIPSELRGDRRVLAARRQLCLMLRDTFDRGEIDDLGIEKPDVGDIGLLRNAQD